jgi:hypothetical protein
MLSSYQTILKGHYKQRALVVAEAQGHFATERKGDARIPIYEEYLVIDDKGNKKVKRKPKLLIPDLKLKTMNLRDEATERAFMQGLVNLGVPISSRDLMVGIPFDFDESLQRKQDETVKQALSDARAQQIIEKSMAAEGFVMKSDGLGGKPVWVTKEQASLEQAESEEQAAKQKADLAAGGSIPPAGGSTPPGDDSKAPSGSGDAKPAKDDTDTDTNAVKGTATGGGGRPNVSDDKKSDAPKPKKARRQGGKDILVEELAQPVKRIKRSMVTEPLAPLPEEPTDAEGSDVEDL